MRQQAMEMHKRTAIKSAQSAADLKLQVPRTDQRNADHNGGKNVVPKVKNVVQKLKVRKVQKLGWVCIDFENLD